MAENSELRDSDNSWVMAGTEGLPVETVGPELGAATLAPADEAAGSSPPQRDGTKDEAAACPGRESQDSELSRSPGPKEAEFKDSEEYPRETPGLDTPLGPGALGSEEAEIPVHEELSSEDPELGPSTHTPVSVPPGRAGELPEEVSSSEDDVEGLRRRRQLRDPCPGPGGPAECRGVEAARAEESGLSGTPCLLGMLALLGVGLLAFSGAMYDLGDGAMESVEPDNALEGEQELLAAGMKDVLQQPPLDLPGDAPGDPPSLPSMSLALDKLAKENQDIRRMQAELQAQKEELQALLQKSEAKKAAAEAQPQSLAGELEQLQGLAPEAGTEMLRASQAAQQPPEEVQLLRRELAKQQGLLRSVWQELEGALQRAQGASGLELLQEELAGVAQQLAQEMQRAESWERSPGKGRKEESRGATERPRADRQAGSWHKKQEAREERRHRHGDPGGRERREQAGAKHPKRQERPEPHKAPGPRDPKGQGGKRQVPHGPHKHNAFWEAPRLQRYRAPQGCVGVAGCARQEGLALFGAELAPVQKGPFLQLLRSYMAGLSWEPHYAELAARLDGAFTPDGTFAHDRLRFRHFVEDVEELLEELAEQEQAHEDAADDFEEHVLRHYGGDGYAQKQRERHAAKQRSRALAQDGRCAEDSPPVGG